MQGVVMIFPQMSLLFHRHCHFQEAKIDVDDNLKEGSRQVGKDGDKLLARFREAREGVAEEGDKTRGTGKNSSPVPEP